MDELCPTVSIVTPSPSLRFRYMLRPSPRALVSVSVGHGIYLTSDSRAEMDDSADANTGPGLDSNKCE